ncbi:pickpocket protein 28-like [Musca autumnalis]|uniref:pickpocket protein 28-like n=1 Tax=Musca autumnalis TaxID=221902 RepID=UPI003CEE8501
MAATNNWSNDSMENQHLNQANFQNPTSKKTSLSERNKKSLRQSIKKTFFEYCSNTSIHGIKYFGENRSWTERLIWIFVFIVSLYWCVDALREIAHKYQETPVIVSFSDKSTDIWKLPFPAVTICSDIKRRKPKDDLYDFADLIILYNEEPLPVALILEYDGKLQEFLTMLQICPGSLPVNNTLIPLVRKPMDYFKILDKMVPNFEMTYRKCYWFNNDACDQLLTKTYTDEGICYTFNGLSATDLYREDTVQYQRMLIETATDSMSALNRTLDWSLAEGYAANSPIHTYPARTLKSGARTGFQLGVKNLKEDVDIGCSGPTRGLKILLHSPDDVQIVGENFVRLSMNRQASIAVKPQMMTTSKAIEQFTPEQRQCLMPGERYLKFFKVYTEKNCELECLTNFTLAQCGCVRFAMPRTQDMRVCGVQDIECYGEAASKLSAIYFSGDSQISTNKCNCLPACTSLDYEIEISESNFKAEALENETMVELFEFAHLHVYYKDNKFFTSHRSELYGYYDFIANCGGIFGLFMGVSLLSVFEILYHITLRLWNNSKVKEN